MIALGLLVVAVGFVLVLLFRFASEMIANRDDGQPKQILPYDKVSLHNSPQWHEEQKRENERFVAGTLAENQRRIREGDQHLKGILDNPKVRNIVQFARENGLSFEIHDHQDAAIFNRDATLKYFYDHARAVSDLKIHSAQQCGYLGIIGSLRYKNIDLITLAITYVGKAMSETGGDDYLRSSNGNSKSDLCFSPTIYWSGIPLNVEFFHKWQKSIFVMNRTQWNGYRGEFKSIDDCIKSLKLSIDVYKNARKWGDFDKPQPFPVTANTWQD